MTTCCRNAGQSSDELQYILYYKKKGALTGSEFESAVVAEIYKQIKTYKLPLTCYHLRTQDSREIDLLLEAEDYYIAIEIKTTEYVNHTDARYLFDLQNILNKPVKQSFILSNDMQMHCYNNNITQCIRQHFYVNKCLLKIKY